jgi:hypothetical protein
MKNNIPAQPLLNRQQMAAELNTTTQVLDRLRRHGRIPHIVCGHFVRFDRDAVLAALQKYTINAES